MGDYIRGAAKAVAAIIGLSILEFIIIIKEFGDMQHNAAIVAAISAVAIFICVQVAFYFSSITGIEIDGVEYASVLFTLGGIVALALLVQSFYSAASQDDMTGFGQQMERLAKAAPDFVKDFCSNDAIVKRRTIQPQSPIKQLCAAASAADAAQLRYNQLSLPDAPRAWTDLGARYESPPLRTFYDDSYKKFMALEEAGKWSPYKGLELEMAYHALSNDVFLARDFASHYAMERKFADHGPVPETSKDAPVDVWQLWGILFGMNAIFLQLGAMLRRAKLAATLSA